MLQLRLAVHAARADTVAAALDGTGGVVRLVAAPEERSSGQVVISGDVIPGGADDVMAILHDLQVPDRDYVLAKMEVVEPGAHSPFRMGSQTDFSWVEVMGHARANSRPLARYLALLTVSGVIAALGVIESNSILIVGAMAVSPDLLPVCATCVGVVGRRWRLARRAFATLSVGLLLVVAVAATLTALLSLTGLLADGFKVGEGGIGVLVKTDYSTFMVAAAAGIAAMLAFETRASAAVGVAISVTTIPASAYIGVALGNGQASSADGAALVLAINVTLLLVSGTLTLAAQRWLAGRGSSRRSSVPPGA